MLSQTAAAGVEAGPLRRGLCGFGCCRRQVVPD